MNPPTWLTRVVLILAVWATLQAVWLESWWWTAGASVLVAWLIWRMRLEFETDARRRARSWHPGADHRSSRP